MNSMVHQGMVDVRLVFEKDANGKQDCASMLTPIYVGDLDKHRSTTGYVFTLSQAPLSWHSTLQSDVALLITEADYMAMTEPIKEDIWLQGLFYDLGIEHDQL